MTLKLAVVGAGWSGLAAAVRAVQAGHQVTVFESARRVGGRARSLDTSADSLDNGQHILIGAYSRTLDLMHSVGVQVDLVLERQPLQLVFADGRHFSLPAGPQALAFARGVMACTAWTASERWALLRWAASLGLRGFTCRPDLSVADLCSSLPRSVRSMLIDPLCVAALNTPASQASAQVLLRVLKDALLGGRGSADLLLPRTGLDQLLPTPAAAWLKARGATLLLGTTAHQLQAGEGSCHVNGLPFDGVVLACSAASAARLSKGLSPDWAATASALAYEPIVTVVLACPGAQLPSAMTALIEGPDAPAQFVFDHGALGWVPGRFAFVISGAAAWVEKGMAVTEQAVVRQAVNAFAVGTWPSTPTVLQTVAEKRATFCCTPGLLRPGIDVHDRIAAAGDYVAGPYPATLEGAVRSGEAAVHRLTQRIQRRV